MTEEERTQHIFLEAEKLATKLGNENFDREKYERDATLILDTNGSLSMLNSESYTRPPEDSFGNTKGKRPPTTVKQKDGSYFFTDYKGKEHQSRDFYEIASQVALQYKELDEKDGKKRQIAYYNKNKDPEKIALSAKAFINNGVMISPEGDIPQSPEFWSQFKQEYLQNNHTEKDWNEITANLPDELLGRPKSDKNKSKSAGLLISQIRNGVNPNLASNGISPKPKINQPLNPETLQYTQRKNKLEK